MPPNSRHPPSAAPPPGGQHPAYGAMPAGFQNMQSFYPNTATQADLQHILRLVSELCDVNANNRKETERLIHGVEKMAVSQKQSDAAEEQSSSADNQPSKSVDPSELVLLQNKYNDLSRRFDQQSQIIVRYADILNDYEDTMGSMMVRVREFAHAHTTTLLQWHQYYSELLQKERDEKHQLFCEVGAREQTLAEARAKFSEIKSQVLDCELPLKQEIAYLKAENQFLKHHLGAPHLDSDDEDRKIHPAPLTTEPAQPLNQSLEEPSSIKRDLEATKKWRDRCTKTKVKKSDRFQRELVADRRFANEKQAELELEAQERAEEGKRQHWFESISSTSWDVAETWDSPATDEEVFEHREDFSGHSEENRDARQLTEIKDGSDNVNTDEGKEWDWSRTRTAWWRESDNASNEPSDFGIEHHEW